MKNKWCYLAGAFILLAFLFFNRTIIFNMDATYDVHISDDSKGYTVSHRRLPVNATCIEIFGPYWTEFNFKHERFLMYNGQNNRPVTMQYMGEATTCPEPAN